MKVNRGRQTHPVAGRSRRGRKSNVEVLQDIAQVYESRNLANIKTKIHGREIQTDSEDEDMETQLSQMDFITDPGSTQGRVSLFQQSVKTYWKMNCLLAKAMACQEEKSLNSSILFELQQIKMDMHAMSKAQIQLNDRVGKI